MDLRALIIIAVVLVLTYFAYLTGHSTIGAILGIIAIILVLMFVNKMYHREVKKDYVSMYPDDDLIGTLKMAVKGTTKKFGEESDCETESIDISNKTAQDSEIKSEDVALDKEG